MFLAIKIDVICQLKEAVVLQPGKVHEISVFKEAQFLTQPKYLMNFDADWNPPGFKTVPMLSLPPCAATFSWATDTVDTHHTGTVPAVPAVPAVPSPGPHTAKRAHGSI